MKKNTIWTKIQFASWIYPSLRKSIWLLFIAWMAYLGLVWAVDFSSEYLAEIEKKYGDYSKRRLVAWQKLEKDFKNVDERKKLEEVNIFFNLLEYRSDLEHWGKEDYWATPLEFVVSGAGDCEDFTVAKYFTLLEMGVPDEKLLITYVKALDYNQAHMVLSYYPTPDSIPLILDNINKEILPANQRKDLQPVYGFNGKGLWQAKQLGVGNKIGSPSNMKRWVELEGRIKAGTIGTFY